MALASLPVVISDYRRSALSVVSASLNLGQTMSLKLGADEFICKAEFSEFNKLNSLNSVLWPEFNPLNSAAGFR